MVVGGVACLWLAGAIWRGHNLTMICAVLGKALWKAKCGISMALRGKGLSFAGGFRYCCGMGYGVNENSYRMLTSNHFTVSWCFNCCEEA